MEANGYKRMNSKYDGFCFKCKGAFKAGTEVWHKAGIGAMHTIECSAPVAPKAEELRSMNAKFAGRCTRCNGQFSKHAPILYSSKSGAMHAACGTAGDDAPRICACRCDGWCENCDPMGCFANNHGRTRAA